MKVLLAVTILLIAIAILAVEGAAIQGNFTVDRNRLKRQEDPSGILSTLNGIRQNCASAGNMAMAPLTWDPKLVDKIHQLPSSCDDIKHGADNRAFPMQGDQNGEQIIQMVLAAFQLTAAVAQKPSEFNAEQKKVAEEFKKALNTKLHETTLMYLETCNPSQSRVGCAAHTCTGQVDRELEAVGMKGSYQYNTICLVGTSNTWPPGSFDDVTTTTPSGNAKLGLLLVISMVIIGNFL